MAISEFAKEYHEKMIPGRKSTFRETDPEFIERFDNFAFDEVIHETNLEPKTRFLAILATLLGCQGLDEFRVMLPAALNMGVTPVEAKEVVYQATAYLGIGRVYPFLNVTNDVFREQGISLPLEGQATNTMENRGGRPDGHLWGAVPWLRRCRCARTGAYQSLAGRQLLWGLLHPQRPGL